jgi:hypothetical protein
MDDTNKHKLFLFRYQWGAGGRSGTHYECKSRSEIIYFRGIAHTWAISNGTSEVTFTELQLFK